MNEIALKKKKIIDLIKVSEAADPWTCRAQRFTLRNVANIEDDTTQPNPKTVYCWFLI